MTLSESINQSELMFGVNKTPWTPKYYADVRELTCHRLMLPSDL